MTKTRLEQMIEKYSLGEGAKYEPKPDCKFCSGLGERPIKKRPSEMTFCICLFVDHSASNEIGTSLSDFAKRKLAEMNGPKR